MPLLEAAFLRQSIQAAFIALGTPEFEAGVVADHLVDAEMTGVTSHGIIRVPRYIQAVREGEVRPDATARIVRETAATAAIDGCHGFGQVMARRAADKAIDLAGASGAGVVTLVNCGHTGRIGHYTEYAATRGLVALMMVNTGGHGQWVAPFGGRAGRLSTNPMSIAAPSGGDFPLVLDMATAIVPEGKVLAAQTAGRAIPEGCVIRSDGSPTTDPADLYGPPRGAILPFGGHKGSGLGLLIDALAGGLSGAGCCTRIDAPLAGATDGILFVAIHPGAFLPETIFLEQVRDLIGHVKSALPQDGFGEVMVAGEHESRLRRARQRDGIPVDEEIWRLVRAELDGIGV
jgi:uncharacterized oxidoreductase